MIMAKEDDFSLDEIFLDSETHVYFIEHNVSRSWYREIPNRAKEFGWTMSPLEALSFKSNWKATTYMVLNNIENCTVTEHEFVD